MCELYSDAALVGSIDTIKWALMRKYRHNDNLYNYAAWSGHLKVLKYMHNIDLEIPASALKFAVCSGRINILEWLFEIFRDEVFGTHSSGSWPYYETVLGLQEKHGAMLCATAAEYNQLATLKWLQKNGCCWDSTTCTQAASKNNFSILKWAIESGCKPSKLTMCVAAEQGNLDMVKWLHSVGCKWDGLATSHAALNGHLETLEWLYENDCPIDTRADEFAARNGHLHILKWLHDEVFN